MTNPTLQKAIKEAENSKQLYKSDCCGYEVKFQPTISSNGSESIAICQKCHTPCKLNLTDWGVKECVKTSHSLSYPKPKNSNLVKEGDKTEGWTNKHIGHKLKLVKHRGGTYSCLHCSCGDTWTSPDRGMAQLISMVNQLENEKQLSYQEGVEKMVIFSKAIISGEINLYEQKLKKIANMRCMNATKADLYVVIKERIKALKRYKRLFIRHQLSNLKEEKL